ncbi:MAG: S8 family serine peptidase [Deltaproteobacteria bacterium]|nr:S8 family serine peptidase [Deltaproteobacteria bacterium]
MKKWTLCFWVCFFVFEGIIWADALYLNRRPLSETNVSKETSSDSAENPYFLVQLRGPVFESQKNQIKALGGHILSYIPFNAFIIRLSSDIKEQVVALPFIKRIEPFKQAYRLSSTFRPTSIFNMDKRVQLIVEFFPGEDLSPILQKLKENDVEVLEVAENTIRVLGQRSHLFFLEYLSSVSWIDEDLEFSPVSSLPQPYLSPFFVDDPLAELTGHESGHKLLDSEKLHALGVTGKESLIGYSDTGLDMGVNDDTLHGDFAGKITSAYAFKDSNWKDTWGHGTHVGGVLAGNGRLSNGQIRASAFDAHLIVQSLLVGGSFRVPVDIGKILLEPAYQDGARIHSDSWGSNLQWGTYSPYSKSVDQFIWEHPDMLVLFASGNSAGDFNKDGFVDEGSVLTPGTSKNCLTVGASENLVLKGGVQVNWQWIGVNTNRWDVDPVASDLPSDHPNGIAAFSSRGPTRDGRLKPEVVAPGTNILSTKSRASDKELWGPFNNDYLWAGGSSMATPLVASGMALVREYLIKQKKSESPSSALLKALIINGAVELYPGQFGDIEKKEIPKKRPNVQEGWGRVNFATSVLETDTRKILFYDEAGGLATSEEKEYSFDVMDPQEPIAITLVYHDFPGALSTTKYLVNDLDLKVENNKGETFYPNGFSQKDDTNNVESVDIPSPSLGELKVKVSAYNVPEGKAGKQPFALVVSGGVREKR